MSTASNGPGAQSRCDWLPDPTPNSPSRCRVPLVALGPLQGSDSHASACSEATPEPPPQAPRETHRLSSPAHLERAAARSTEPGGDQPTRRAVPRVWRAKRTTFACHTHCLRRRGCRVNTSPVHSAGTASSVGGDAVSSGYRVLGLMFVTVFDVTPAGKWIVFCSLRRGTMLASGPGGPFLRLVRRGCIALLGCLGPESWAMQWPDAVPRNLVSAISAAARRPVRSLRLRPSSAPGREWGA